jgi:hypothetical protein
MKKTDPRKCKFGTTVRIGSTAYSAQELPFCTINPRMGRVLCRLPAEILAQEELHFFVACCHTPEYLLGLRKIRLNAIYRLCSCHDRDGCHCQLGIYYMPESDRAHGRDTARDSAPCYQNDVKKLPASAGTFSALMQLDEKRMKQTLLEMAANVQALKTKEAKKSQVHLLCLELTALLQRGKQ